MGKVLYFEGAGCVPCNDVENCRIRTAFSNKEGKKIYLEMIAGYRYNQNFKKLISSQLIIEECFVITDDASVYDEQYNQLIDRHTYAYNGLDYSKKNILKTVNKLCNTDFDEIVVLDNLAGYRVFTDKHTYTSQDYNFSDDFIYDEVVTKKRIDKVNSLKETFSNLFNQKHDNTSYWVENGQLIARLNVSDEDLQQGIGTKAESLSWRCDIWSK